MDMRIFYNVPDMVQQRHRFGFGNSYSGGFFGKRVAAFGGIAIMAQALVFGTPDFSFCIGEQTAFSAIPHCYLSIYLSISHLLPF